MRHQACASEFDYAGWKAWGVWRRDVGEQVEAARALEEFLDFGEMGEMTREIEVGLAKDDGQKDCWGTCDYPSECRWGKQYGVATPVVASTPETLQITLTMPSTAPLDPVAEEPTETAFNDIVFDMSDIARDVMTDSMEGIEPDHTPETPITSPTTPTEDKKPSMDDLLASVRRRKRRSAEVVPSPLASNPPSPISSLGGSTASLTSLTPSAASSGLQRAFDDFEVDLRSSIGRAGEAMGSLFGARTSSLTGRWGKKRSGTGTW